MVFPASRRHISNLSARWKDRACLPIDTRRILLLSKVASSVWRVVQYQSYFLLELRFQIGHVVFLTPRIICALNKIFCSIIKWLSNNDSFPPVYLKCIFDLHHLLSLWDLPANNARSHLLIMKYHLWRVKRLFLPRPGILLKRGGWGDLLTYCTLLL